MEQSHLESTWKAWLRLLHIREVHLLNVWNFFTVAETTATNIQNWKTKQQQNVLLKAICLSCKMQKQWNNIQNSKESFWDLYHHEMGQ